LTGSNLSHAFIIFIGYYFRSEFSIVLIASDLSFGTVPEPRTATRLELIDEKEDLFVSGLLGSRIVNEDLFQVFYGQSAIPIEVTIVEGHIAREGFSLAYSLSEAL
jgi:hypothetical protein